MANFVDVTRKLTIVLDAGTTDSGTQVTKTRTFSGLSETAAADKVLEAGNALGSLMDAAVLNVYVKDVNEVLDNSASGDGE